MIIVAIIGVDADSNGGHIRTKREHHIYNGASATRDSEQVHDIEAAKADRVSEQK